MHKKLKWNVTITQQGNTIHDKDYPSFQEIAKDLGLSPNKVFELSPKGRSRKSVEDDYIYATKISITKI
jgi:hypothetical protein